MASDDQPTNQNDGLHQESREFLEDVREEFRDPECPKCGHRTSLHVARFYDRESPGGRSRAGTACSVIEFKSKPDGTGKGIMRLDETPCDCNMRHDEIYYNLNLQARRRSDKLDKEADERYRLSQCKATGTIIVPVHKDPVTGVVRVRRLDGSWMEVPEGEK